jgi:hypothetical protein
MWNYRLVQSKDDDSIILSEVYYNDDKTPYGFCNVSLIGENPAEILQVHKTMKEAFDKDILLEDKDFHPMDDDEIASEDFRQFGGDTGVDADYAMDDENTI